MLLVFAALSFGAAIFIASESVAPATRRRQQAVAAVRRWSGPGRATKSHSGSGALARATDAAGRRLTSDRLSHGLSERLAAAGLAGRLTMESFVAIRFGLAVIGVLGALSVGAVSGLSVGLVVLFAVGLAICGFLVPSVWLTRRARARREQINEALPDALDLLAVTVEAGLGLYGAIQRLVETTAGPLADEFALVLTELRVGDSSERALKRMAKRVDSPEVTSFVRSLIQGEQLGISLGRTLRNLAEDTRNRRRAVAEEKAAKAPVKMLFPTALFIFPALFIVILGPAVLEIKKFL